MFDRPTLHQGGTLTNESTTSYSRAFLVYQGLALLFWICSVFAVYSAGGFAVTVLQGIDTWTNTALLLYNCSATLLVAVVAYRRQAVAIRILQSIRQVPTYLRLPLETLKRPTIRASSLKVFATTTAMRLNIAGIFLHVFDWLSGDPLEWFSIASAMLLVVVMPSYRRDAQKMLDEYACYEYASGERVAVFPSGLNVLPHKKFKEN